jgi:nucleotide-binding universal stress UspA family protein
VNRGPPLLLCFDGSDDAAAAITAAGRLLAGRQAVVLTVWEPVAMWEPYDPATIISAPLSKLASHALGVDEVSQELAQEKADRGVRLADEAGFTAEGRVLRGKPWRVICDLGQELDADPIVVGARGLSRVQSVLLGSVSSAVVAHAERPVLVIPRPGRGH